MCTAIVESLKSVLHLGMPQGSINAGECPDCARDQAMINKATKRNFGSNISQQRSLTSVIEQVGYETIVLCLSFLLY